MQAIHLECYFGFIGNGANNLRFSFFGRGPIWAKLTFEESWIGEKGGGESPTTVENKFGLYGGRNVVLAVLDGQWGPISAIHAGEGVILILARL